MCDELSFLSVIKREKRKFNSRQLEALKLIYDWRDELARDEDEGPS